MYAYLLLDISGQTCGLGYNLSTKLIFFASKNAGQNPCKVPYRTDRYGEDGRFQPVAEYLRRQCFTGKWTNWTRINRILSLWHENTGPNDTVNHKISLHVLVYWIQDVQGAAVPAFAGVLMETKDLAVFMCLEVLCFYSTHI